MKWFLSVFVAIFCATSFASPHHHHEKKRYYGYDTEGTAKDRIKHQVGHGALFIIKSPFLLIHKGLRGGRSAVRYVRDNVEIFLSDAASVNGDREKLHNVLVAWENSDDLRTIMENERRHGRKFLFGIPSDAWKLLKNVLHTAGFTLPRATWHTIKSVIFGSRDMVGV